MTNILQSISNYDIKKHLAYPTIGYIKEQTGEDILLNQEGNSERANAFVIQITQTCWNIIKSTKQSLDTISRLEYMIATDESYRQDFLDFVCSFIYDMYSVGAEKVFESSKPIDSLSARTRALLETSKLSVGTFSPFEYQYRVGY